MTDLFNKVVMVIPAKGGSYELTEDLVHKLSEAYPRVDVMEQCERAKLWCEVNVCKRKTARGMPRFLNAWMSRVEASPSVEPDDKWLEQYKQIGGV